MKKIQRLWDVFLAPATRLMDSLKFSRKFTLISLAFILPTFLLLILFAGQMGAVAIVCVASLSFFSFYLFGGFCISFINTAIRIRALAENASGRDTIRVKSSDEMNEVVISFETMLETLKREKEDGKSAHEALARGEARLRAIVDNTTSVIFMKDTEGRYLMANRQFEVLFHTGGAEVIGKTDFEIFPESEAIEFVANDRRVLQAGRGLEFEETAMFDDGPHTYLSVKFPLSDGNGRIYAVCGIATDITERKSAEDNIIRLHEKLAGNLRQLEAANIILQHEIAEREKVESDLRENRARLDDVNRRLQENHMQLIQSEKMAGLGQLAAGIAHEVNNPLGYVISNLSTFSTYVEGIKDVLKGYDDLAGTARDLGVDELAPPLKNVGERMDRCNLAYILGDISALVSETKEGADRVKDIVQRLKVFARADDANMESFNVNDSLDMALKLVWSEIKYKCRVTKNLGPVPTIRGYPGQLCQVFMNLILNASQAIHENGDIFVESGTQGNGVRVLIRDNGCGIKPEHLPMIFTPFFTTKPQGKGTGLGMSISYGIIKKHKGEISVASEVNQGTTFTIFLPFSERKDEYSGREWTDGGESAFT